MFVLALLKIIVSSLGHDQRDGLLGYSNLFDQIPKDPRAIYSHFDLHPRTQTFICCPSCYALYPNDETTEELCSYQATVSSELCGTSLFLTRNIRGKSLKRPVRLYVAQSLKEWVGRLLSRKSMEQHLETPWVSHQPHAMQDIWDGQAVRGILGPDGTPFLERPPGDSKLRLVFSLSMDGFNPFGIKTGAVSVSAIYMTCLNLPPHLRYKMENIFLAGVIPGPHKPSLDQINHAQAVLLKELQEFWSPGVQFSRTVLYTVGRLVLAILLLLIADIPAARQMGGFASVKATFFCSCCMLTTSDIENFDMDSWVPCSSETHREHALLWLNTTSDKEREEIFKKHGIRWTPLLDLSYWKPVDFMAIDSMHAHWINSLINHLEHVWGLDPEAICTDGALLPVTRFKPYKWETRPSDLEMWKAAEVLLTSDLNVNKIESALGSEAIFHLCFDHDIRRAGTKIMRARHLVQWVHFILHL